MLAESYIKLSTIPTPPQIGYASKTSNNIKVIGFDRRMTLLDQWDWSLTREKIINGVTIRKISSITKPLMAPMRTDVTKRCLAEGSKTKRGVLRAHVGDEALALSQSHTVG